MERNIKAVEMFLDLNKITPEVQEKLKSRFGEYDIG